MGICGPDALVMDFHCMLLCFIAVALSFCVSCNCTDEETHLSGDQAGRLRHMWLLSMRDAKRREKAVDESNPARGLVTHQLLYCRVGIGFHLQILANGSVWGVHEPSEYSLLRVFAMRPGIVGIRGVKSELYLCMNQEGIAHGMKKFSNECLFKERMEENHYNTYSSLRHAGFFLALSQQGKLRKGNRVGRHQACTHFLPRKPLSR
ncbi:fibroblast growth factor 4A isoform X2 [Rhinichthys klamathensis goyatoka]|uniref:fibroblast growth factor 4A isoform X2 n=1 Tax=Rhinichthys klamathensis goyatoka TaxID=3034132 RepID=UPI0024B6273E|nr:fibroblast growth factor 4A isoform X2 [Rhinichthys klamathensis goyatoka]